MRFTVIVGRDRISHDCPVEPGQILKHRGGSLLLRCPQCRTLGIVPLKLTGPDSAPTVMGEVKCGCISCSIRYRIEAGQVRMVKNREVPSERQQQG